MKGLLKSQLVFVLVLSMIMGMTVTVHAEETAVPVLLSLAPLDAAREASEVLSYYETAEVTRDWEALIAQYAAGYEFEMGYFDNLGMDADSFDGQTASYYGSRIMGLVAIGADPRNYFGVDLLAELAAMMDADGSFGTPTDQMYAMLALNIFETPYEEDKAVDMLLSMQSPDGGFGFAVGSSDLDTTGVALTVLGQYKDQEPVQAAIEKAVTEFILPQQLPTGGFPSWGSENSNTIARVITGLVGAGYDIYDDAFLVDGHTMLDALMAYELEDHSYTWQLDPAESNGFSTKQVLMAYADVMNGRSAFDLLKDMNKSMSVGIRVEGASANILDVVASIDYFGYGMTAGEVIQLALDGNEIPYIIETSQYGSYVSSINGETAGTYGGYDGWMYLINGASGWGIDSDIIHDGDQLLLYYGDMAPTTLVPTVLADALVLAPYEPFRVSVTATYDQYDENWNPTPVTVGVEGVTVMIGDVAYTTDKNGYVTVPQEDITFDQAFTVSASKNNEGGVPSIVRTGAMNTLVTYDPNKAYNDSADISTWASEAVYEARDKEIMLGTANVFSPKKTLTKAELSTLIVRMTGKKVADYGVSFNDVMSSSWYYDYISTGEHFNILEADTTYFDPGARVTRGEFAEMVAYAFGLESEDSAEFTDLEGLDSDVVAAIAAVDAAGLLVGNGQYFNPDMTVTREMAAVVMMRIDAME